jgi:hypothetical protein
MIQSRPTFPSQANTDRATVEVHMDRVGCMCYLYEPGRHPVNRQSSLINLGDVLMTFWTSEEGQPPIVLDSLYVIRQHCTTTILEAREADTDVTWHITTPTHFLAIPRKHQCSKCSEPTTSHIHSAQKPSDTPKDTHAPFGPLDVEAYFKNPLRTRSPILPRPLQPLSHNLARATIQVSMDHQAGSLCVLQGFGLDLKDQVRRPIVPRDVLHVQWTTSAFPDSIFDYLYVAFSDCAYYLMEAREACTNRTFYFRVLKALITIYPPHQCSKCTSFRYSKQPTTLANSAPAKPIPFLNGSTSPSNRAGSLNTGSQEIPWKENKGAQGGKEEKTGKRKPADTGSEDVLPISYRARHPSA